MRIALVVDNPVRDLDGLTWTARLLSLDGWQVFLVPMNQQMLEVPAIAPDLVVVNYVRSANAGLLRSYAKAGIGVVVLDTEGGVWESAEQFAGSIAQEVIADISLYCLWGKKQLEVLLPFFKDEQLVVTGHPRYDFCSEPLSSSLKREHSQPYVLLISNFTLAYPRFSRSADQEVENMCASGYDREYALGRVADDRRQRLAFVELVAKLRRDLPGMNLVIRPHPFEDDSQYRHHFGADPGVTICREGMVASWIKYAAGVLHISSSVAIEAYLLGQPALRLAWLSTATSTGKSPLPVGLSCGVKSYEDLLMRLQAPEPVSDWKPGSESLALLEAWFHSCDGQNGRRVVAAINALQQRRQQRPEPLLCRRLARLGGRPAPSLLGLSDVWGRKVFGPQRYADLRTRVLTRNTATKKDKSFSMGEVEAILRRCYKGAAGPVSCRLADDSDTVLPRVVASSLHLSL